MANPKKVFVLIRSGKIECISYGCKTAYLALITSLRPDEHKYIKSYEQVWRIIRKKGIFHTFIGIGIFISIEKYDITTIDKFKNIEFHKSAYKDKF